MRKVQSESSVVSNRLIFLLVPVALIVLIGLISFTPLTNVSLFNQTRILELILLAWLSIVFLLSPVIRIRTLFIIEALNPSTLIAIFLFFALGLTSASHSQWKIFAFLDWAHYLLIILAILTIAATINANIALASRILMAGIIAGITIALIRLFIQIVLTISMNVVAPLVEWWTPYSNPRFIAQALVWTLPLLSNIPAAWPLFRKHQLIVAHALCIGAWMMLFWTGSRGEILCLAFGMLVTAFLLRLKVFTYLIRMACMAFAGFALWALTSLALNSGMKELASLPLSGVSLSLTRTDASGRGWLLERSMQLISQHPWLGVGPAHFSAYDPKIFDSAHPHNLVVQIAVEWGLLAAGLLIYLAWRLMQHYVYLAKQPSTKYDAPGNARDALRVPLLVTLFAVALTSFLDGIHVMPLSELIGITIMGLMIAINQPAISVSARTYPFLGKLSLAFVLLCWGILLHCIYQQSDCLNYPIRAAQLLKGKLGENSPRFWVQGRIPLEEGCLELGRYRNGIDNRTGERVDAPSMPERYWY